VKVRHALSAASGEKAQASFKATPVTFWYLQKVEDCHAASAVYDKEVKVLKRSMWKSGGGRPLFSMRECGGGRPPVQGMRRWAASGFALKKAEVGGLCFLAEESGGGRPLFLRRGLVEVGGLCFTSGADVSRLTDSRSPNGWVLRHTSVSRVWVIGCLHSSCVSCFGCCWVLRRVTLSCS